MTDEEKKRIDELISNLEWATGQILLRDKNLTPLVDRMRKNLWGLRALLGVEHPH